MPLEERKSMSSMTNVIQNIVLENREKLKYLHNIDWYSIIKSKYKRNDIYLSE